MEKDRVTAITHTSTSFIVVTNHDAVYDDAPGTHLAHAQNLTSIGLDELVSESMERKKCMAEKWRLAARAYRRKQGNRKARAHEVTVSKEILMAWVMDYPITKEYTHYAALLDPKTGEVAWARHWETTAVPYDSSGAGSMIDLSEEEN